MPVVRSLASSVGGSFQTADTRIGRFARYVPILASILATGAAGCAVGATDVAEVPEAGVGPAAADTGTSIDAGAPDTAPVDTAPPPKVGGSCVTTDDCTAPDLCTNAQVCIEGRCIYVGGAPTCDDGIDCTIDSCDPATGRCVHVPNDKRCAGSKFCDVKTGCVDSLPCKVDATCARLNDDACKGTWSCNLATSRCSRAAAPDCKKDDACNHCQTDSPIKFTCTHAPIDYATDVKNCGGCAMACPDRPNATAVCLKSDCKWTCLKDYFDLDGELSLPRTAKSKGCACHKTSDVDVPDLELVDRNCDGIVGDVKKAVFVSPSGNDSDPGTMDKPKQTLAAAIAAASVVGKDVYADKGTYDESVALVAGVGLYGGYDSKKKWARALDNASIIQSDDTTGVTGNDLTKATEIQLFTIKARSADSGSGNSSYGVRLTNSPATVTVRGCTIQPGDGGSGASGSAGTSGDSGGNGAAGAHGGTAAGGSSSCGAKGGDGGPSVSGTTGGRAGSTGTTAPGGAPGGAGGSPGSGYGRCFFGTSSGGEGGPGSPGTAGSAGGDGSSASTFGGVGIDALYTPAHGRSGTAGRHGGGAGGGGSGGGDSSTCGFLGLECCDSTSGGGGAGGAGGCGGTGGGAGKGGGGSFGIVAAKTLVVADRNKIFVGRGGSGGSGGAGGGGGSAGSGAPGGSGDHAAGSGGRGAAGGVGGSGGNGSGGAGGPSVCLYYSGSVPTYSGNTCVRGGGGVGGAGGGGFAPRGPDGVDAEQKTGT